jgi:hypothetical protein
VFLWFAVVGGITVVMSGGVTRPRRVKPAPVVAEPAEPEAPLGEPDDEVLAEQQTAPLILPAPEPAAAAQPSPAPEPEPAPEPLPPVDHQALAELPDAEDFLDADNDATTGDSSGDRPPPRTD